MPSWWNYPARLSLLEKQVKTLMSTAKDLQDAVAADEAAFAAHEAADANAVKVLNDHITALEAQVAAGATVPQADLDAVVVRLQALGAKINAATAAETPAPTS